MDITTMNDEGRKLAGMVKVLKDNNMPQETINMVLAARCGLPLQKVDLVSMYVEWEGDPEEEAPAAAAPENETSEERFKRVRGQVLSVVEDLLLVEGLEVLASAMNEFAAPHYRVSTVLHEMFSVEKA